jgi:hypothetical protein
LTGAVSCSHRNSPEAPSLSQTREVIDEAGRKVFIPARVERVTNRYLAPVFPRVYRFNKLIKADIGASYELPLTDRRALRFFGYVDNLSDHQNFESGFRTPGRAIRAGASLRF